MAQTSEKQDAASSVKEHDDFPPRALTRSKEQGARSNEQGAKARSKEQGIRSKEQGLTVPQGARQ